MKTLDDMYAKYPNLHPDKRDYVKQVTKDTYMIVYTHDRWFVSRDEYEKVANSLYQEDDNAGDQE